MGTERPGRRVIIRWSANQNELRSTIFFLYTILSCSLFIYCSARDTITADSGLTDGKTLVSAGERFELGFFTPTDEMSDNRRYIGIWYYKSNPRVVLWVANRDKPLPRELNGVFAIADGNLELSDDKATTYWYADLKNSLLSEPVAKLKDSGNLVLSDDQFATSPWESFKYPTHTFLAGMKMDENLALTSWISQYNPAKGNFTFKYDYLDDRYIILKDNNPYWKNEESGNFLGADEMPSVVTYLLSNFSRSVKSTYKNVRIPAIDFSNTRLTMSFTGQIQYSSKNTAKVWSLIWEEPGDRCDILNFCGRFGICNSNNRLECKCLPGFVPKSRENWISGDFSGGCSRQSELCSGNDTFLSLKMMKTGRRDYEIQVANEKECLENCRKNCQCQAYSYYEAKNNTRRGSPTTAPTCWIWTQDPYGLREESPNGGHDLHVRVATSDIESTKRSCGTCGSDLIPYPLSTKPNCGDPDYFSFQCDTTIGQLSFKVLTDTFRVTRIDPDARTFSIQITDNCGARNSIKNFQLNISLPFFVASSCDEGQGNSSSDILSKGKYEVKVGWQPPLPPTCTSQKDCENWPHSTCKLQGNQENRCFCHETYHWDDLRLNCTQENVTTRQDGVGAGGHNKQDGSVFVGKKKWTLIVGVIIAGVIILSCTIVYFYLRRKFKRQEDRASLRQNMAVRFYDSARHVRDLVDTDQFKEEDQKAIDLPFFDFEKILAATDNFSEANKLGKGGFGPVYKGKFPGGQEIAVKRLSSVSGQGLEEFKNEVVLIARLQHRNLVRLLGYCIQGGEKILLYEYMPNKSLDSFIFDPTLSVLLDWDMRFNIILGIARGLLYLHQDSRLRIIHRDLKTSNILLDQEMNPKISDFGLAKIFEGKQTEGTTTRVVGTYGYMSPEYALDGFFSVKSDVFSFGVVVLEIVSGKRNTGFYNSEAALSLLGYAWRLWQEDKALDIMDQKLSASSKTNEILRCINVGLLCVQEDPNDRPNMSNVVIMLGSETATLPTPKRPAFVLRRGPSISGSSSSKPETNTMLTVSLAGR